MIVRNYPEYDKFENVEAKKAGISKEVFGLKQQIGVVRYVLNSVPEDNVDLPKDKLKELVRRFEAVEWLNKFFAYVYETCEASGNTTVICNDPDPHEEIAAIKAKLKKVRASSKKKVEKLYNEIDWYRYLLGEALEYVPVDSDLYAYIEDLQ